MPITYSKLVKGIYLLLLTSSAVLSFIKPNPQTGLIAILSIVGFIAFDTICYLRDKNPPMKDLAPELQELREAHAALATALGEIKNDHSIAHLASTFKRK
jgi:hypothetical protein